MPLSRAAGALTAALTLASASCTLISLDQLQQGSSASDGGGGDGAGAAGAGGSMNDGAGAQGGGGATTTDGGGENVGGFGGAPEGPTYEECILEDMPAVFFHMSGVATEPNVGTLGGTGTYAGDHTTVPGLVEGDDFAASMEMEFGNLLNFPGAASVFEEYDAYSIEVWVRLPEELESRDLVRYYEGSSLTRIDLQRRFDKSGTDSIRFRVRAGGLEREAFVDRDLVGAAGDVMHIVAVYRQTAETVFANGVADDMLLYVDAELVDPDGSGAEVALPTVTGTLDIANGFDGTIDEVAVYPRELTPEEIERHYARGAGEPCVDP